MSYKVQTPTSPTPRFYWIDIVKFWGIFAIVWGHTLNAGNVHHYLYSFHVPLFFFVIGLFFSYPKIPFLRFTIKKAVHLLIPYFIFAIISILIFYFFGNFAISVLENNMDNKSLSANFLEMLSGQCQANRPLWFLPCIFLFYILCFIFSHLIENCSTRLKYTIACSTVVLSVALCFINENILEVNALFWKVDVALFMFPFAVIASFVKPIFTKYSLGLYLLFASSLLLSGGIIAFSNSVIGYLNNHYGNVFLFYISANCSIIGFCFLSLILSHSNLKFITKTLVFMGQKTLPILLMHKFPILFFQTIFPFTKQAMKNNNEFVGFIVAVISIIACLLVDMLLQKSVSYLIAKNKRSI